MRAIILFELSLKAFLIKFSSLELFFASIMFSSRNCFLLSVIFASAGQAVILKASHLVAAVDTEYYPGSLTTQKAVVSPGNPLTPAPGVVHDVVEIIKYMSRPIILTAFLCWKIGNLFK